MDSCGSWGIASFLAIVGWVFEYGQKAAADAGGWVQDWARASGSHEYTLWWGLGLVFGLMLMAPIAYWIFGEDGVAIQALFLVAGFVHMLVAWGILHSVGWTAELELAGGFTVIYIVVWWLMTKSFYGVSRLRGKAPTMAGQ